MRAIRQYEFGSPDVLRYETVPDPRAGAGQIRVAVDAAGVHVIDTAIRGGNDGGPFPVPELPMTPGREVAGIVDRVGPGVASDWLGRRVVTHLGQVSGGYAELALAAAERLHDIPPGMPASVAVAMIGTGRTAVGILERAQPTAEDVVVVTSAAGGLGALFVQEARAVGASVVALAGGPAKVERARELGADVAVDYLPSGWPDEVRDALDGRRATLVLDGVGGAIGRAAFELLCRGGRLARFGRTSGAPADIGADEFVARAVADLSITGAQLVPCLAHLESVALEKAASGAWRPLVQKFPLARAAEAHRAIESRATTGKVVLVP